MRCLIRIFGCLISAFGMLVSFGAAVADTCKTSQGEVFERTPIGTFTFTVGWNTDGATGAFYQAAEKWGGISYWTQQPSISGDNYIIPGGTYVALNSACYTSPSAMSWVDDYDCGATFNGSSLTCLYDGSYLYSPGTGMWLPRKGKLLLSQKMGEVVELGFAVTLSLIHWRRCNYLPGFSGNRFSSS